MATYLVGYDINPDDQGADTALTEAIRRQGLCWCTDESTWLVVSEKSAVQIRDALASYLKQNDQLLVVREDREAAWAGFGEKGSDWPPQVLWERCAIGSGCRI